MGEPLVTPTRDTSDHLWRRRAERMVENAQRSLADAGLSFADDEDITGLTYYLRYEDAGATPSHHRRNHAR